MRHATINLETNDKKTCNDSEINQKILMLEILRLKKKKRVLMLWSKKKFKEKKLPFPPQCAKTSLYFSWKKKTTVSPINGIFQDHDIHFDANLKNRPMPSMAIKNPYFLHVLAPSFPLLPFIVVQPAFPDRVSLGISNSPSICRRLHRLLHLRFFFQHLHCLRRSEQLHSFFGHRS